MIEWGTRGKASVLVGGQFGSEGKGLAAAWLAETSESAVGIATTNAGAQAGHTTKYADGRSFVCFHLPTIGVVKNAYKHEGTLSYINAGSIIDADCLFKEIADCGVNPESVLIHPRAAVITPENRVEEREVSSGTARTASTQKGVGAALTGKIMRRAKLAGDLPEFRGMLRTYSLGSLLHSPGISVTVEVPQGTSLGINHGVSYPYCTSRECTIMAGLSDAGVHPSFLGPTCMVVRTFPIRVGHLRNEDGELIGESGPFASGSTELDWAKDFPDVEPERTTVTKRVRRIATWSHSQYEASLILNRPTVVFLNFCNYLRSGEEFIALVMRMLGMEEKLGLFVHHVYGFGPCVEDVTDDIDKALVWYDRRAF